MQFVNTAFHDGIGRIILNRPDKRNALTHESLEEICYAIAALKSSVLRVMVLESVGPVFCAGMDLTQMQQRATHPDREQLWRADAQIYHDALLAILECRVPTVAAVQGPVIAGGMGLVLACDIVISAESVFFALPEPKRGIIAALVAPLLRRRTSLASAGYVLLSGKRQAAHQALRVGLCDEVVPDSELQSTIQDLLQSIMEGSPNALAKTKQILHSHDNQELRNELRRAIDVSAASRATSDAREGLEAFLAKRTPLWTPASDTHDHH